MESQAPIQADTRATQAPATVLPPKATQPIQNMTDPVQSRTQKRLADEKLRAILQDRRFAYMKDFSTYDDGKYFCTKCLKWCPTQNTRVVCKEVAELVRELLRHAPILRRRQRAVLQAEAAGWPNVVQLAAHVACRASPKSLRGVRVKERAAAAVQSRACARHFRNMFECDFPRRDSHTLSKPVSGKVYV